MILRRFVGLAVASRDSDDRSSNCSRSSDNRRRRQLERLPASSLAAKCDLDSVGRDSRSVLDSATPKTPPTTTCRSCTGTRWSRWRMSIRAGAGAGALGRREDSDPQGLHDPPHRQRAIRQVARTACRGLKRREGRRHATRRSSAGINESLKGRTRRETPADLAEAYSAARCKARTPTCVSIAAARSACLRRCQRLSSHCRTRLIGRECAIANLAARRFRISVRRPATRRSLTTLLQRCSTTPTCGPTPSAVWQLSTIPKFPPAILAVYGEAHPRRAPRRPGHALQPRRRLPRRCSMRSRRQGPGGPSHGRPRDATSGTSTMSRSTSGSSRSGASSASRRRTRQS